MRTLFRPPWLVRVARAVLMSRLMGRQCVSKAATHIVIRCDIRKDCHGVVHAAASGIVVSCNVIIAACCR